MSTVRDIQWNSADMIEPTTLPADSEPTFRALCNSLTPFMDEDVMSFLDLIHADGQETALRTLLYPDEVRRATQLRDEVFLYSLYNPEKRNKTLGELIQAGKDKELQISEKELKEIADCSQKQIQILDPITSRTYYWLYFQRQLHDDNHKPAPNHCQPNHESSKEY